MSELPEHLRSLSKSQLEGMCINCGMCCFAAVPFGKGNVIVPELRCSHLDINKSTGESRCSVYEARHDVAKGWCMPLAEAIEKGVLPPACPYVVDMPSYVGSSPLSDLTYELIKPDLVRALAPKGKPTWLDDRHWQKFLKL